MRARDFLLLELGRGRRDQRGLEGLVMLVDLGGGVCGREGPRLNVYEDEDEWCVAELVQRGDGR